MNFFIKDQQWEIYKATSCYEGNGMTDVCTQTHDEEVEMARMSVDDRMRVTKVFLRYMGSIPL